MDDHVAVIHHHPAGVSVPFLKRGTLLDPLHPRPDGVGNGVQMDSVVPGANQEYIGEVAKTPHIENGNDC